MSRKTAWLILPLIFSAIAGAQTTQSTQTARQIYDRVAQSLVVLQYTYDGELGRRDFNTTGIVVSEDGLVIGSGSLTPPGLPDEQMKDFKIIIPGDEENELDAEFQGRDDRTNLTFVKVKEHRKWTPLRFEDVPVEVGDSVVAIGLLPKEAGYKTYLTQATV
ncbi:MAG TPA: trypsin-like peptidase domain-containing protein, partial [Tepidisphaeraceae bacterium]|nr:trypsin-like peptidase domain-containing protein [Tepidisphaeraceae bacterium]